MTVDTPSGGVMTYDEGEGTPLLFVHGYCGNHGDWSAVAARSVAGGRRVIAIDLPGHGASSLRRLVVSVDDLGTVIERVLVALDLSEVTLAGHSLGSMAVLRLAERDGAPFKERVAALGLISCSPTPWRPPEMATVLMGSHPLARPVLHSRSLGHAALRATAFASGAESDAVEHIRQTWRRASYPTRWAYAVCALASPVVAHGIERVALPTAIITGTADRLTPPDRAEALARRLPEAALHLVEDAGHAVLVERPDAVADALLEVGDTAARRSAAHASLG
jgi:pimeloyl-ACP methyl ester carboxylesterase